MKEIWKDIEGYEGKYQVSNLSKIKSLKFGKERILKQSKHRDGYSLIGLSNKGIEDIYVVSRLVAIAFILNPLNLPFVLHKDEKLDENGFLYNGMDNLFWGTAKDNVIDKHRKGRDNSWFKNKNPKPNLGKFGKDNHLSKKVYQYSLDGEFIKDWDSIMDIQRELGIRQNNISACCNGRIKTSSGFIWKFNKNVLDAEKINNME